MPIYFAHISDTHIGPTRDLIQHGHHSYSCAQCVVEIINNLPQRPDFVIHTGDVTADPHPNAYALARDLFAQLDMPIYYVAGNHDDADDIRHYLSMGAKTDLLAGKRLVYAFEVQGERFLVLDAKSAIDPLGYLPPAQLDLVRREATPTGPPLTVFLHYPVLPMDSRGMDRKMLLTNGEKLHKALLPARERLRGVFHGHIHQPMQTIRDGITYISAASTFAQFRAWPTDPVVIKAPKQPPGFNFVHLLPTHTLVHQHRFIRPNPPLAQSQQMLS